MTIPRPRLTVRRLMIAVALAGVALGGWIELGRLRRLGAEYADLAEDFRQSVISEMRGDVSRDQWVARWRWVEERNRGGGRLYFRQPLPPEVCRARAAYFERLRAKYDRASRFPWLAVEPDPRMPDMPWSEPE